MEPAPEGRIGDRTAAPESIEDRIGPIAVVHVAIEDEDALHDAAFIDNDVTVTGDQIRNLGFGKETLYQSHIDAAGGLATTAADGADTSRIQSRAEYIFK